MNFDIVVIGSGPAGYVAAIRSAQLGFKTAIIEKESLGGVCLNWGCIPTKSLLKSVEILNYLRNADEYGLNSFKYENIDINKIVSRSRNIANTMSAGIDFLMKKNNIYVYIGKALLKKNHEIDVILNKDKKLLTLHSKYIIIATGSSSRVLNNIFQNGLNVIGYREALSLKYIPKNMVIVGGGVIGIEFAYFYSSLGCKVTVIENKKNILYTADKDISMYLASVFRKKGIRILTSTIIEKIDFDGVNNIIHFRDLINNNTDIISAKIILSAVGVIPNVDLLGIEEIGINIKNSFISVDKYYQTNVKGYYAIGDVINTPALAHVASCEAIKCIEGIRGICLNNIDYNNIPFCVYSKPEIAYVGLTEQEALDKGLKIKIGKFSFMYSGKANVNGSTDGFIKVIFDQDTGEWLGCHMIGDNVTEIISEVVVARNLETTGKEIINSIHPHPTLSECLMEAVADAYNESINK